MTKLRALYLTGALVWTACGDNSAHVPIVTSTTLDFGSTPCGTAALPQAFVISNPTSKPLTFTATLGAGANSLYRVAPATGVLPVLGELAVTVYSRPIPDVSAITPNLYGDTLTISTDAPGDGAHAIALTQGAYGVILTLSTPTVDFSTASPIGAAPQMMPLVIQNVGNAPTSVMVTSNLDSFSFAPTALTPIAAGASLAGTVNYSPFASGSLAGKLEISASGPLCAPIPTGATTGTGTFAGTAADVLVVGPGQYRKNAATICVLLTSGQVACLGSNQLNARGAGLGTQLTSAPTLVRTETGAPLDHVVELTGARAQVCARRTDGSVYCWGNVTNDTPKNGGTGQPFATQLVAQGAISIASNYGEICTLVNPGGALSCVGQAPTNWRRVAPSTWTVTNATKVSLNSGGGYALQADGTVLSFGLANHGARGNADIDNAPPSAVTGLATVTAIAGGGGRASGGGNGVGGGCALLADATVRCWGAGRHGSNGDGTTTDRAAMVQVMIDATTPLAGVTALAAGRNHRCAITPTGVYCWGRGDSGELGRIAGTDNSFAQPTDTVITNAVTISAAARGSCAVLATHGIRCWGVTPVSSGNMAPIAAFEP